MKYTKKIIICATFVLSVCGVLFGASSQVHAGYDSMSNSLPDDNYELTYNGSYTSGSDCAVLSFNNGRNPVCLAGGNGPNAASHQYLTLSEGSINNVEGDNTTYPAKYMDLKVYTKNPTSSKQVMIGFTDRGIGPDRACNGYTIAAVYSKLDGTSGGSDKYDKTNGVCDAGSYVRLITIRGGKIKQASTPSGIVSQGGDFQEIKNYNPKTHLDEGSGIYAVNLRLEIQTPDKSKQASFHLYSTNGSKLGFRQTVDESAWINQYPTAVAKKHTLRFKFRAPCGTGNGAPINVSWDDGNNGKKNQPFSEGGSVRIYATKSDGLFHHTVANYSLGDRIQAHTISNETYDGGKPFSYVAEFTNIYGGNGISFRYPYDSGSFWQDCPNRAGDDWQLKNASSLPVNIGSYNPSATDTVAQKVTKAKAAYQNARFQHNVWNPSTSPDTAKNGQHQSFIEYRVKRAGSATWRNSQNGDTGNNAWQRKSDSMSKDLSPGDNGMLVNDDGVSNYSIARSVKGAGYRGADLAFLLKSCATGNNCDDSGAGPRTPVPGDQYCERVVTVPYQMTDGSASAAKLYSNDVCITLGSPVCYEFPWSVGDSSQVYQSEGDGDIAAAWVGDKYNFDYNFTKEGAASQTKTIAFTYNNNGTNIDEGSRTLGSWGKSYTFGPVKPEDGGRSFVSSMSYSPARSAAPNNCGSTGSGSAGPYTVNVPYYFHIKPSLEGVSSSTEQGDPVDASATYNLPTVDPANGRGHTWTDGTQYKITVLVNPASTDTSTLGGSGNVCAIAAQGCSVPAGASGDKGKLMPNGSSNDPLGAYQYPADGTGTAGLKVGTKVCFVASLTKPSHDAAAGTWAHSEMRCTSIVKKPKVQFLGGDLTVGRSSQASDGSCAVNSNAIIQTAPRRNSATDNTYGSWIEFGAFAPGAIRGFGSAAYSLQTGDAGLLKDAYKKLLFANTFNGGADTTPGRYTYSSSSKCLSDAFGSIQTKSDSTYNLIGNGDGVVPQGSNYTLVPGNYFAQPGKDNRTYDKTGYATPTGSNLVLGKPVAVNGGAVDAPASDNATTGGTYTLPRQCDASTASAPSGWSQVSTPSHNYMYFNSGCNGFGSNYLTAYWVEHGDVGNAVNGGDYVKWRYTPPANTSLDSISADVRTTLGRSAFSYEDPFIDVGGDSCTPFYQDNGLGYCPDTRSYHIDPPLQGQSEYTFGPRCSVNSGATHCRTNTGRTTGVGLANIDIRLKDMAAPVVSSISSGGLYREGPASPGTIGGNRDYTMTVNASDGQSGLNNYVLFYKPPTGDWIAVKNGNFGAGNSVNVSLNPQSVFGFGTKGTYAFKLFVYDRAGNHSQATTWTKDIDNSRNLDANYDAFTGRNIVVYARKNPNKTCNQPGAGGNITISDNITYKTTGYESIAKLPRVIFLADCNITIEDGVTQVDAWLIAREDIRTCSEATIAKFINNTVDETQCTTQLTVNGAVQAKRLLLLRTYGADLAAGQQPGPAEVFNLRPEQILSTWSQGQTAGVTRPIYETDLPPRW